MWLRRFLCLQVSHRPVLIGAILSLALLAEWSLERMEEVDGGRRGVDGRGGNIYAYIYIYT